MQNRGCRRRLHLIRPSALDRIGGMASIRGEIIDDCALARAVKRTGGGIWLGVTNETTSIREYNYFSEIRAMISRTAFAAAASLDAAARIGTILGWRSSISLRRCCSSPEIRSRLFSD